MTAVRKITLLGSTGSIGENTLDVVARHADRFQVCALTANKSVEKIFLQCQRFHPQYAVMLDHESAAALEDKLKAAGLDTQVLSGVESLEKVASLLAVDIVMAAIVGAAGIRPTIAAARSGKSVMLGNKKTLVMAGRIFIEIVKQNQATLLPIDSEHNAIYQSLPKYFDGNLTDGAASLGQWFVEPRWRNLEGEYDGHFVVQARDGTWGMITPEGEPVTPFVQRRDRDDFNGGILQQVIGRFKRLQRRRFSAWMRCAVESGSLAVMAGKLRSSFGASDYGALTARGFPVRLRRSLPPAPAPYDAVSLTAGSEFMWRPGQRNYMAGVDLRTHAMIGPPGQHDGGYHGLAGHRQHLEPAFRLCGRLRHPSARALRLVGLTAVAGASA